jgi:hypothetical protein
VSFGDNWTTQGQQKDGFACLKPAESPASSARKPEARSRVTNGKELLANIDGRSTEARRYRDLCFSFADDCGGAASLTEAQRALVRQAASLVVQSERLASAAIRGELVSDEQQTRVANALGRTLNRLGIKKRVGRKLTVPEYLEARDARMAAEQC